MDIKLIIFDMDGVLFDSEPYHARAEKMMLSRCGIHEELGEQAGKSHADIWTPLIERYQLKISQPELERQQNALTMQLMRADAGSNVKRRKPYPDIYQAVLRECGVEGRNALAVEDTDTGMRAAVSAGIPCLGYRNPTSGNQKLDMGCTVIEKMMEIPAFLQEI